MDPVHPGPGLFGTATEGTAGATATTIRDTDIAIDAGVDAAIDAGIDPATIAAVVRVAGRAPSGHDTPPWR